MRSKRIMNTNGRSYNNILARYIKNEPQTTLPILTAALFIGALFNKIGYFNALSIPKELINFNIFQYFMNNDYVILGSLLILSFLYIVLYRISKRAILVKELVERETLSKKEKCIFIIQTGKLLPCFLFLIITALLVLENYKLFTLPLYAAGLICVFFLLILVFYILIILKQYALALIAASLLFIIISYSAGSINANVSQLHLVCVEDKEYEMIDYFDDKYILRSIDEEKDNITVKNLSNISLSIKSFNQRGESCANLNK